MSDTAGVGGYSPFKSYLQLERDYNHAVTGGCHGEEKKEHLQRCLQQTNDFIGRYQSDDRISCEDYELAVELRGRIQKSLAENPSGFGPEEDLPDRS